jgi:hypothetical protein
VGQPAAAGHPPARRPDVVLVVMDDFSTDLLPTMRSAAEMQRRGASYPYSFVTDSLCCVSRSSIFTGQYPHQTGVRINTPSSGDPAHPLGGYEAFKALDFIATHHDDQAPWFLEVAPYAPHSRVGSPGDYPGDPVFPPAFRDRPTTGHPNGNCGPVGCGEFGVEDLTGYGDDLTDNAPSHADGSPAPPACAPLPTDDDRAERTLRNAPGWCSPSTGW